MRLEKLQMRGFKTFADKTELNFGPGITAIVGPNGVGKSNIADAVLWALGEQGTVSLRVESSEDVIFAGSESRRPLGMAEVGLTLDNSDHNLNCEYSEVEISRRLFRTGKSEYLLNRNKVRLRDIQELLVDTGLGTDSYALVGQGEIDALLSARPEDRRELIEEVAGVRKYRIRRSRAELKLSQTQDNLIRIRDIIHELRRQREPLEQQAEVARRYQKLSGRLHHLQRSLLAADYVRRRQQRGALLNDIAVTNADLQATRNKLSVVEANCEQVAAEIEEFSERRDELREEKNEVQRTLDRQRSARAVASEKLHAVDQQRQQLREQLAQARQRQRELQNELDDLQRSHSRQQEQLEAQQSNLTELEETCRRHEAEHHDTQQQRQQLQEESNELSGEQARIDNELAALGSLQEDLDERIARLARQRDQLAQQHSDLEQSLQQLRQQRDGFQQKKKEVGSHRDEARQRYAALVETLRDHRHKRDRLAEAVTALESRQGLLQELEQDHEGYLEGPRALLEAGRDGRLSGVEGLLADFLDVPRKIETAVEAGLGPMLQWVLVSSDRDLQRCVEYLCNSKLGRATVVALNKPIPRLDSAAAGVSRTASDVLGTIDSLVGYPHRLRRLLDSLLAQVLVAEDLDAATRIWPMLSGSVQVVTLNGEVVGPAGQVSAGRVDEAVGRSFDRRRELVALDEQLQQWGSYLAQMWETEERLESRVEEAAERVRSLEEELSQIERRIAAGEGDLRHAADRFRAASSAHEEVAEEISGLEQRRQQADIKSGEAERQRQGLQQELQNTKLHLSGLPSEQVAGRDLDQRREKLTAARVKVAELEERLRSVAALVQRHEQELSQVEQRIGGYRDQLAELDQVEQQARQTADSDEDDSDQLQQHLAQLSADVDGCQQDLSSLHRNASELEKARRGLAEVREEYSEQLHRRELQQARQDSELEHIVQELEDVYELTPEQAREQQPEGFDAEAARREANQLKKQIRNLGYVNVSAIEECERLRDREQYLSSQLDDLREARDDLEAVIAEIDETARQVFVECFEQVAQAFDDLFKSLFDGGSTRLELTDPDDPLSSGVEVIVQQPGRRFQNLVALSGGEKAMTALALLFAMIRVKPTPFCFLDEIDAALDGANSQRFARLLKDFSDDCQFVIVTHNPETMQVTDTLHGVTMEQAGVSKLISVELTEAQRDAERWAADGPEQMPRAADKQSAPAS